MPGELARGRACYRRRAWADAYRWLALADQAAPLGVEDVELLARSAALTGRDDDFLRALERTYHAHLAAGDDLRAARAAFWLVIRLFSLREPGRASGWLTRAHRLVDRERGDCVERGYLMLPVAYRHLAAGAEPAAYEAAAAAAEIGDRLGDADLSAFARNLQGRALMRQGRVDAGLALVDEAMVAATSGELSPLITGLIYCSVIGGCQQVYALDRAREWTSALADWCGAQPQLVSFTVACQVHRSEVMQLGGAWGDAIDEARRASARAGRTSDRDAIADSFYQQGEIHRLRGEVGEAEQAYRSASDLGREPQPGLALLRLAQDRRDVAASTIRRVLGATTDRLRRARLLPACVEILLAVGDKQGARRACEELEEIAAAFKTDVMGAMVAHARGTIRLAEGDAQAALEPLRHAFQVWQAIGAPYIVARIRVLLGQACRALGDADGGALELAAARKELERLGAAPDVARIDALGTPKGRDGHGLTPRELEVLRLVASGKTNKAIARELSLSQKTVDRHVSNIFTKVDVSSRSAATAYAYRKGLV